MPETPIVHLVQFEHLGLLFSLPLKLPRPPEVAADRDEQVAGAVDRQAERLPESVVVPSLPTLMGFP